MNWLDVVILVVVAWFTISGFSQGLILEALSLAGLVLGIYWGAQYHGVVAPYLFFLPSQLAPATAFILILVVVSMGGHLAGSFLRRMARLLFLGWLDRLGGAVFGLAKAVVILGVAVIILANLPLLGEDAVDQSRLAPYFLDYFAPYFLNYFPDFLSLLPADISLPQLTLG